MNIDFTGTEYLNNTNYKNYWEKSEDKEKKNKTEKKKVSFDDILNNMNLVVNKDGVLQMITSVKDSLHNNNDEPNKYNLNQYSASTNIIKNDKKNEPIDPSVKHSYIYNKYFKDYVDTNLNKNIEPIIPKTKEEYYKMLIEKKIKDYQNKKLISEIKSTKMIYTTNIGIQRDIQSSKNNLKNMRFR